MQRKPSVSYNYVAIIFDACFSNPLSNYDVFLFRYVVNAGPEFDTIIDIQTVKLICNMNINKFRS
jgi:hypothetical protein